MWNILLRWVIFALILMLVAWLTPGLEIANFWTAMIAAFVITIINAVIKPIVMFLTLPINFVTLGIFTLVINALLFMLAAYLVKGIELDGFLSALIGSILISIFSVILSIFKTE